MMSALDLPCNTDWHYNKDNNKKNNHLRKNNLEHLKQNYSKINKCINQVKKTCSKNENKK